MLIAVDHGNKQIKTVHTPPFTSGLIQSDAPGFGTDALAYRGKYYTFILFSNSIYRKEYATQHDYQEDIPSDIFPYDYRYAACQKIENWNRNYAQAQGQPKRLHNMRPVVR